MALHFNHWFHQSFNSFSLPVTYGITLNELGEETVHKYQGKEPSGRKTDDIALDYNSKCLLW